MICRDCTIVAHKNHKHVELPTIASSHRDKIKGLLVSAQEIVTKLNVAVDNNITTSEGVETSAKEATQTIRQTFENLHKALDDRMNELLGELHTTAVARTTALGLQRESYEVLKQNIGHNSAFSASVVQTYTDHELLALNQLPFTELQATLKKAESMSLLPCQHSELTVILKAHDFGRELSNLGYVVDFPPSPTKSTWKPKSFAIINVPYQLKVETKDSKGQKYNQGGMQVLAEIQPKTADHQVVAGKVEDHRDGTYTITLTPQVTGPHQLLITMDGEHIRNSPYVLKVRVSKPDYRSVKSPKQLNTNITSPLCMAIHNSGDIFIGSESNCIYVFNQAGVQKAVIGSAGDAGGQFNKPSGLAIKGDVLYVADCNNHRIQVLSVSGEFLHMFGKLGSGQGEFNCPSAVVVDSNDRLIVADCGNCRVQVMDSDGTCLLAINERNIKMQNILGLTLDTQDNIHVSDVASIKVLTSSGSVAKSYNAQYGLQYAQLQQYYMWGQQQFGVGNLAATCAYMTIDNEGRVFIGAEGNNSVVIFDPPGNYYHSVMVGNLKGIVLDPYDSGSVYIVVGSQRSVQGLPGSGTLLKYEA